MIEGFPIKLLQNNKLIEKHHSILMSLSKKNATYINNTFTELFVCGELHMRFQTFL